MKTSAIVIVADCCRHHRSISERMVGRSPVSTALIVALTMLIACAPSMAVAQTSEEISYYHTDAVGSVRVITNQTGAVVERYDYVPFGQLWQPPVNPVSTRRFAGKERDAETGLDYFGARYYASRTGRFTTIDPVLNIEAALTEPQRWNRYAYALNNPLAVVDPDGRDPRWAIWTRIVQSAPVQRVINHPATQRVMESAPVSRATGLLGRFNDRLFDLSLKLFTSPADEMIAGPLGTVGRGDLERAMTAGGQTIELVTKLTQSPAAGRALSAAGGEGAQALAAASRAAGNLYLARIPEHAIKLLERAGLVTIRNTMMNGVRGIEYRFRPEAMEYLSRYFEEVPK